MSIPIEDIEARARKMHEYVAGLPPEYQGAVIAHLLATWIAGHRSNDVAKLAAYREELLTQHAALVREMIPLEDERIAQMSGAPVHSGRP